MEDIDTVRSEINIIEYSNVVKEIFQDSSRSPKNPGMAVRRGKYKLENDELYLIKYQEWLDADAAVSRARSRLGERKYNLIYNNCEHFVVWCKTCISCSEQVSKVLRRWVLAS